MRRRARSLVLILGLLVVVALDVPGAVGQTEVKVAPDAEAQFVARINELRRSKGVGELTVDGALVGLARRWAASMAAAGAISHNPNLRHEVPESWERVGENVGVGGSVESLHEAFVASPTHYRNLVEPRYTRIGVGVVRTADGTLYTTHLFLQPRAAAPPRAARSRASAAAPADAAAPTIVTTMPPAVGDAMTWRSLLEPAADATAGPSPGSLAEDRSGATVPGRLLVGALAALALIVLARAIDRRHEAVARRGTSARADRLAAALGRYTATTPPVLPLTTGLRWIATDASSLDAGDADLVAGGELAATLAPYAASHVVTRRRREELIDDGEGVVIVVGRSGHVRYASPEADHTLGHPPGTVAGLTARDFVHPDDAHVVEADGASDARVCDVRLRHRDGSWRHVEVAAEDRRADPRIAGVVLRGADVTERRAVEAEMRNRVERDPVTGLLGRPALLERLGEHIEGLDDGEALAVLAVRLGGLEAVHEAHGPAVVDCLVAAAADRLQHDFGPAALLGRYGDHDFAVVAGAAAGDDTAASLAHRSVDVLRAPFVALAEPVTVVASVGFARVERSDVGAAQALQEAFVAMRSAQRLGGGRVEMFTASLRGRAVSRLDDERALRRALAHDELCLQYQPIVRTSTGIMTGVEALLRWDHPRRGLVSAAEFIGVAEEAGFAAELSWWALRTACAEAVRWARTSAAFRVSVNVAPQQLAEPAFADRVLAAVADADASPSSLCLELTEASLLNDMSTSARQLQAARDAGVTVAVDDFGTGYSSLGYLQHLPIDTVKIDRSFVADLGHTRAGDTIASAVVGLAHGLGLAAVAEGVETNAQAAALAGLGCDQLQGYLCSPARPATEIDGLMGQPLLAGVVDLRDASANSSVPTR